MTMINCADCEKEMSDSAPACPNCGKPNANAPAEVKPISTLLGIGILLSPFIFSWFTLRKGYATKSKVISFVWMALVLVLYSYGSGSKGVESNHSPSPVAAAPRQAMLVNIQEILSAYTNNEVGADNKYKGNIVQVSGIVGDIKKDLMDNLYVTLGTGKIFEIPMIQAFFDDSMNSQLGQLRKGQKLTIVCRINGLMMNVLAKDCVIK